MNHTESSTEAKIQIQSAVPTFLVADVAATARWYAEHLGFGTAGHFPEREPYVYASLQRDGAELMLLNLAGYRKPDLTSLRTATSWCSVVMPTFLRTVPPNKRLKLAARVD